MTQLLLSVRDAEEAHIALAAGAALVDCKEPLRGALGRPDAAVLGEIVREIDGRVPISVACGELADLPLDRPIEPLPAGVRYAKIGMAGCGRLGDWPRRWHRWADSLPEEIAPVAVIYLDPCRSLQPETMLGLAFSTRCAAVLFDTFDKSRGDLWRHVSRPRLGRWLAEIRGRGLLSVVGGSLSAESIARFELAADFLAIRGAACRPNREGRLCAAATASLASALAARQAMTLSAS